MQLGGQSLRVCDSVGGSRLLPCMQEWVLHATADSTVARQEQSSTPGSPKLQLHAYLFKVSTMFCPPAATAAQVNGDSGNDIELFEVPGVRGCVVANAHPELRQYAEAAIAAGSTHIAIAREPLGACAGGIVQTLMHFGSVPQAASGAALLRGMVSQLGLLQSNAMAGNLSYLSEKGATWVTPAGRVLEIGQCTAEPADAAAAGLTWVDSISARPLLQDQQAAAADAPAGPAAAAASTSGTNGTFKPGELLVVTYQLWGFKGQSRDSSRVRQCSAIVHVKDPAAADGYKLLHLHEGVMDQAATATAAFQALAAAS